MPDFIEKTSLFLNLLQFFVFVDTIHHVFKRIVTHVCTFRPSCILHTIDYVLRLLRSHSLDFSKVFDCHWHLQSLECANLTEIVFAISFLQIGIELRYHSSFKI